MSSSKQKDGTSFSDQIHRADRILEDIEDVLEVADNDELPIDSPQNSDLSDGERAILEDISEAEGELDHLQSLLKASDDRLVDLGKERQRFDALVRLCEAVDALDALDAGDLFWGDDAGEQKDARLAHARKEVERFEEEIASAERGRDSILEKIDGKNLALDSLDTTLRDAMEAEERRRAEWIVENEARELAYREQVMPWARGAAEDERFRKTLGVAVLVGLLLAWILPMIDLPLPLRDKLTEVPDRVADVIRRELPEPEPPPPAPEQVAEEEPVDPEKPEELVEEAAETPEDPAIVAETESAGASEPVEQKGILAFRDNFANSALERPNARLGSEARVREAGENAVGRPERSMVTTSAPGSSGGINLSNISRDVGGGGQGIEGVALSQVESSIGSGQGPNRPLSAGLTAGRTDEEIQIVFDRYKAALYRLYNRELRRDPTLRGQIVLTLTIEPDGSVSMCEVQSTDMNAPALAAQVVNRVKGFDFGAKEDVSAITIVYPIDFLPAG